VASVAFELLEQRTLPASVMVASGVLMVVDGGTEANNITMGLSGDGMSLVITDSANALTAGAGTTQDGAMQVSVPIAGLTGSQFMLGSGDDVLTLDFANGSPVAGGNLTYGGGGQTATGDSLNLINVGNLFSTHTYGYVSASDGTITLNDGLTDTTVSFTGLEPVSNDGTPANLVFNLPVGNNTNVTLSDTGTNADGMMLLAGSTFENTTFSVAAATTLTINGSSGNDSITVSSVDTTLGGTIILNGGSGNDTLTGSALGDQLNGGAGLDVLNGGAGADTLTGGTGNDTLTGGTGNDTIDGQDGDDAIIWNDGDDNDSIDGGSGRDVLTFTGSNDAGEGDVITVGDPGGGRTTINRTMGATIAAALLNLGTVESITINTLQGDDTVDASAAPQGVTVNGGAGNDTLSGSGFVDRLDGGAGDDSISGNNGDDLISGGVGVDTLNGGAGADTIIGGVANTTVTFNTNFGSIPIELFDEIAPGTVASFLDYVQDGDYLNSIIHRSIPGFVIQGGGFTTNSTVFDEDTTIIGNVPTDPPIQNEGLTRSNTRGTISTAQQSTNINTFTSQWFINLVNNTGLDSVPHVVFGQITDMTVPDLIAMLSTFDITAETGNLALEDVPLTNTPASGTGSLVVVQSLSVGLIASSTSMAVDGADVIDGGDGSDTVNGSGGNDTITGGANDDSLAGGDGDDLVNGGDGADLLDGQAGDDVLNGNDGDDALTGGAGNDTLDGGAGSNRLVETGDTDFELSDSELTTGNLGTDMLTGIGSAQLTGGNSANIIDAQNFSGPTTLNGSGGADVITAGGGASTINGGAGNDTITGSGVADSISGGDGNDSVVAGAGADIVTGDAGDDILSGGDGNDTLRGGAGLDTLNGGAGNDSLLGEADNDQLSGGLDDDTLDGGVGDDRVTESADTDFTLTNTSLTSAALGTDTLVGITRAQLTGGASGNTINASAFTGIATLDGADGNDIILSPAGGSLVIGGAGADSITGGAGADTISGDAGNDTIRGGAGNDSIQGGDDDDLLMGGLGADTLSGGAGNDRLVGISNADLAAPVTTLAELNTADSDVLLGGDGNDTIVAGLGKDTVDGGAGDDLIDVASGGTTTAAQDSVIASAGTDMVFADPEDEVL